MAFFPANVSYPSILGEMYSAAFTAPAFNWLCSPAVTELETIVLDWLANLLHLPSCFLSKGEGGDVIQGSASEAIVTVMVAARERYLKCMCEGLEGEERERKRGEIMGKLVALGSEQSHSSTQKAALITGVRYMSISTQIEDDLALTGTGLGYILEKLAAEGLEPFFLTTTLGTTATCAVDRFAEVKNVIQELQPAPPIWVYVDAAYAGAALLLPEHAHFTSPFTHFDSFNVNMHKWLLTNFDASLLYVRTRSDLTSALSITPSYLRNEYSDRGLVTDNRDWQIPLGRRFRALKIWFVVRTYGVKGLKRHVQRHIDLGEMFAGWICERKDLFTIIAPPAFGLTVFTLALPSDRTRGLRQPQQQQPDEASEVKINEGLATQNLLPDIGDDGNKERTNALTKEVYERVNREGEIYLTSSVVKGIYAIRVVSANERTDESGLRRAFEILVRTSEEVLGENKLGRA